MSEIIRLEGVRKIYGVGDLVVNALNGVDLKVDAGEYCAIMGASGSGKSTMMNIIGCLDRPSFGEYYLDGVAVASMEDDALATICVSAVPFVGAVDGGRECDAADGLCGGE
jgi:putative ABC transport system ATP-binding protein